MLSNNLELVGCRIPKHSIALDLLASVNFPIAAPSANLATKISSTQTNHLSSKLKENAFLIDGGKTTLGLESTVVKLNNNSLFYYYYLGNYLSQNKFHAHSKYILLF